MRTAGMRQTKIFCVGRKQKLEALERPQLLFDSGVPIALFYVAADAKGRDGSFNVQIPLKTIK